jgi:hypothetical protein
VLESSSVKPDVRDLIARHGIGKLATAYCRELGWRPDAQGRNPQWYRAWRDGLGDEVEKALATGPG